MTPKKKDLAEPLLTTEPTRSCGERHWAAIFYANVFMACIAFSIVMPSLWLYLESLGSNTTFYALVVSAYSIGEALGSLLFGPLSVSLGVRRTLLLCSVVNFCGATSYAMAYSVYTNVSAWAAPLAVLLGRLLQGTGSGGQQAVESAGVPESSMRWSAPAASSATASVCCASRGAAHVDSACDSSMMSSRHAVHASRRRSSRRRRAARSR